MFSIKCGICIPSSITVVPYEFVGQVICYKGLLRGVSQRVIQYHQIVLVSIDDIFSKGISSNDFCT